jgi:hypothetical protein
MRARGYCDAFLLFFLRIFLSSVSLFARIERRLRKSSAEDCANQEISTVNSWAGIPNTVFTESKH